MATNDSFTSLRSRLALLIKNQAGQQEIEDTRRAMNAARLRDLIEAALAKSPPMTAVQRRSLANILLDSSVGGAK